MLRDTGLQPFSNSAIENSGFRDERRFNASLVAKLDVEPRSLSLGDAIVMVETRFDQDFGMRTLLTQPSTRYAVHDGYLVAEFDVEDPIGLSEDGKLVVSGDCRIQTGTQKAFFETACADQAAVRRHIHFVNLATVGLDPIDHHVVMHTGFGNYTDLPNSTFYSAFIARQPAERIHPVDSPWSKQSPKKAYVIRKNSTFPWNEGSIQIGRKNIPILVGVGVTRDNRWSIVVSQISENGGFDDYKLIARRPNTTLTDQATLERTFDVKPQWYRFSPKYGFQYSEGKKAVDVPAPLRSVVASVANDLQENVLPKIQAVGN